MPQTDPLPSWNDGPAKQAIIQFVQETTDQASPNFVPPEERIATFDQDGTLWVEHPMYTQVMYCLERVPAVVKAKPELKNIEPFKTVLSGNREAVAKLIDEGSGEDPRCHAHRHDSRQIQSGSEEMDRNGQGFALDRGHTLSLFTSRCWRL